MNQTNLHYINCGNQFVNATGDGINQVQSQSCRIDGQCFCWVVCMPIALTAELISAAMGQMHLAKKPPLGWSQSVMPCACPFAGADA